MAGDLIVVPAPDFAATAADYIARAIGAAADSGDSVSLAVSGGRGPRQVYQELARTPGLPWDRVTLYFADERAVPPDDPRSNYRLVTETLGARFSARPGSIHRMEAERPDLAQAAAEYESLLPIQLDLLVLGMGEDGHTASLFPHHPATREERRRVLGIEGPAEPAGRMTITPPVIRAARATLMLVSGEAKAAAVARAVTGAYDPVACPAQLARGGCWILDQSAATRLDIRSS